MMGCFFTGGFVCNSHATSVWIASTSLLILLEGKPLFSHRFSNQVNKILSALLHGKLILHVEGGDIRRVRSKVRRYL